MNAAKLTVLSLRCDPTAPPFFDVKDILATLDLHRHSWVWCVRNLDWLGDNADELCRAVEAAPHGLWLKSWELADQARGIYQTIDGIFLAFTDDIALGDVAPTELDLGNFLESRAELAIAAFDGCYFDLYAKKPNDLALLRSLKDPRCRIKVEDAEQYFPGQRADNSAAAS